VASVRGRIAVCVTRLILETALHTVLLPGTVIVALPYLLLSSGLELHSFRSGPLLALGGFSVLAGIVVGLWCTRHFVVLGHGTPNPLDPPKFLVRAGPYRVVRNPMYVAVGLILAGEALAFGSVTLVVYLFLVLLVFHLFVILYEEPALRRLFGPAYQEYCRRVPRWIPGLARPARGADRRTHCGDPEVGTKVSDDVRRALREAYDRRADDRDRRAAPAWEVKERDAFLRLLQQERKHALLELGAATGADAAVFGASGLEVVCLDLSPAMVRRCRARGLVAHVMDVADLRFPPGSFDAAYAMNCLVHIPKTELRQVLAGISRVLRPAGLFYLGLYGGREFEGIWDADYYEPKRFFSHHTDDHLRRVVAEAFAVHSFARVPHGWDGLHFQSLILRKAATLR
jgi:protein-S-isoprenylcysteine O-methyltransferase Ste14/SAM-dependent methyltransferase